MLKFYPQGDLEVRELHLPGNNIGERGMHCITELMLENVDMKVLVSHKFSNLSGREFANFDKQNHDISFNLLFIVGYFAE